MATEKAETDRVPVTLALSTITYLEKLVKQGTHGTSVPGVARTLIEEGIRLAIKDGLLSIRDNGKDVMDGCRREAKERGGSPRIGTVNMFANLPTWTTERVERLKKHFEAGLSCRQIAVDIGVSRNAVIGKLSRLGLTRGKTIAEPRAEKPAKGRAARSVPRLQYQMLQARLRRGRRRRRRADSERAALLAVRTQQGTLPLADQHARRRGFLLLRQPAARRACPIAPATPASPTGRARGRGWRARA